MRLISQRFMILQGFNCPNFILLVIFSILPGVDTSGQNLEIPYKTYGDGPEILIVSGHKNISVPVFEELAQNLAEYGFKTILYNPVGTDDMSRTDENVSVSLQDRIDEIENLRKELGVDNWNVVGTGFGSMIVCYYITDFPQSVKKMVFISPWLVAEKDDRIPKLSNIEITRQKNQRLKEMYPETPIEEVYKKSYGKFLNHFVSDSQYYDVVEESLQAMLPDFSQDVLLDEIQVNRPDSFFLRRNFSERVLVISGDHNNIHPRQYRSIQNERALFLNMFDVYQNITYPDSGIFSWLEKKDEVFQEIKSFLLK
jgi:pimeloyl-ACP methyl ester carboxylesterase